MSSTSAASWRRGLSLTLSAAATAALLVAFPLVAPPSSWNPAIVTVALAAIGIIGYFSATVIREVTLRIDAGFTVALLALVLLGPLPAAMIWIATDMVAWFVRRPPRDAVLANIASFGWAAIAGSLVLHAVSAGIPAKLDDPTVYPAMAIAGFVLLAVNFAIARGFYSVIGLGRDPVVTLHEFLDTLPGTMLMLALCIATAWLYTSVGVLALGFFALITIVPQTLLPRLLKRQLVTELEHSAAVAVYADAIGDALEVSRDDRLVLKDASQYLRERPVVPRDGTFSDVGDAHRTATVEAVLYYREHWDGQDGTPGAVGGEMIPLTSRILAVADAWSGLTAKGSHGLSHGQALNQLEARAGMHFDPRVVKAAIDVVRKERLGRASDGAWEPWLHRVPLPRLVRLLTTMTTPGGSRRSGGRRSGTLAHQS